MVTDDELIYAETLLPIARERYPTLNELIDEVEMAVPGVEALAKGWIESKLSAHLPLSPQNQSLESRTCIFAVTSALRGIQLSRGVAREVEADALFPAAACARSIIELVGLGSHARALLVSPAELSGSELAERTARLLLGARSMEGAPANFSTADLINAGRAAFGDHFGADYGFLSDLSHPNLLVLTDPGLLMDEHLSELSIHGSYAETLINIAGNGLRLVSHNAIHLLDLGEAHPIRIPSDDEPGG